MPEVHNPNLQSQGSGGGAGGAGGDFRSTMAIMLVVLAAFLGYQYFFAKPKPAEQPPAATQTQPAAPSAQVAPAPGQKTSAAAPAHPVKATPEISASQESELTVENELYMIVLTNRGALVKHWILKKYFDSSGKPLDLVQPEAAARFGSPISLFTYEPVLTSQLNQALYQSTATGAHPTPVGLIVAPASVTFHYAANGLDVVKILHFDSSYVVTVETQVLRDGQPVRALVEWPAGLGDMEEFAQSSMIHSQTRTPSYFAWSLDGKESSQLAAKVSGNNTIDEPYQYAAITDLYFAAAFLPANPDRTTVVTLHNAIDLPSNPSDPNSKKTPDDVLGLAIGDTSGYTKLRIFAGPKATDVLSSIHSIGADGKADGPSLEPLIEFGMWSFIAKPLYLLLRWMVKHGINNWGWAIIISTVVFNLLLLPTRISAMKSSLKTMRIQPKVDAIKNRYKSLKMNDPKRGEMNTEMMALYKAEGVNMYGSCLPMLVPLILLWPYFRVLQYAVELRQAHWMWLPDLSQPDPTYILPILIIISMFFTQYITPSPGMDPAQRRMMAFIMPIFFGFMLLHYASGLALYWCTGNVIMLAMQIGINRSHWGKEMHEIAARRSAKKLGANPKTIQGRR
ncbi:Membrane protein insertase YidC [Candidatus Sulfotelmatomonas gaucii]|uniref:Membrane protein insertase YidC n=1 Tax=Candidatus Sulfuritelmatomonas gaucii TaxID=2043161 RepID=A0A2N9LDM1_9BACT|nr:Membrane protein insertase YidC [Candidatus Sulfotelmatomonas gaucii]